MSGFTRHISGLVLMLCCCGIHCAASGQASVTKKALPGTVSGRVTIEGNGAPGVVVALRTRDFSPNRNLLPRATTDEDGNYRITRVPAGSYLLFPLAPVFVFPDVDQYYRPGKPLVIAEGEEVTGFDIALTRGGVIMGKVVDREGRPLIEERVRLIPTTPTGIPLFTNFQTDDRGIYRLFGVPKGSYRVAVGEVEERASMIGSRKRPLKQTFHPDTSDESKAMVIEVKEGQELSGIDITVGTVIPGFTATGRVVDGETGRPIAGARYGFGRVVEGRSMGVMSPAAPTNSNGEFRIEGLANGRYVISLFPQSDMSPLSDEVEFEVRDHDVTNLVVKTSQGASLTGHVVLEGGVDQAVRAKFQQMRLSFYMSGEGITLAMGRTATLTGDGKFHITGLRPGFVNVNVFSYLPGEVTGFSISRLERDGIVQSRGIEIKPGEQVSGVRVVVVHGTGVIRGAIKFENGTLPPGGRVMVFLSRTGERSAATTRPVEVDSRGHFVIAGLASGDYELRVNAMLPGWRGRRPPMATQPVVVVDGTVLQVAVTLDLQTEPGP